MVPGSLAYPNLIVLERYAGLLLQPSCYSFWRAPLNGTPLLLIPSKNRTTLTPVPADPVTRRLMRAFNTLRWPDRFIARRQTM